jgi:hypothetical protein
MQKRIWVAGERRKGGRGALSFPLVGKSFFFFFTIQRERAIGPKARGLAQHGGLPDWLEESDPAGVILYVLDCGHTACLFSAIPVALTGMPSFELMEISAAVV